MAVPMCTSQDFVNWVCGKHLNPNYLRFALVAESDSVRRWAIGSTHQTLYYPEAKAIHILLPSREIQDAVAEVLGALDDKIAANRRVVATSDKLIAVLIEQQLTEVRPLWEAVRFTFGEAFNGSEFGPPGSGRPLIRIRDIKSQKCQIWTTESRPRERVVSAGEVLVGMDAEFDATRWSGSSGLLNQRVMLANSETYGDAIVREILMAPLSRIERSKSGTTVIHLNKSDLERETALVPLASITPKLRAIVDPIWHRCVAAEQESVRLAVTRNELLALLMTGKISIRGAEERFEQEA